MGFVSLFQEYPLRLVTFGFFRFLTWYPLPCMVTIYYIWLNFFHHIYCYSVFVYNFIWWRKSCSMHLNKPHTYQASTSPGGEDWLVSVELYMYSDWYGSHVYLCEYLSAISLFHTSLTGLMFLIPRRDDGRGNQFLCSQFSGCCTYYTSDNICCEGLKWWLLFIIHRATRAPKGSGPREYLGEWTWPTSNS